MSTEELNKLASESKVTSIFFDSYEIEVYFENGLHITIGREVDYECAIFTFDTNIEREERNRLRDIEIKARNDAQAERQNKHNAFLSSLTKEQLLEYNKLNLR